MIVTTTNMWCFNIIWHIMNVTTTCTCSFKNQTTYLTNWQPFVWNLRGKWDFSKKRAFNVNAISFVVHWKATEKAYFENSNCKVHPDHHILNWKSQRKFCKSLQNKEKDLSKTRQKTFHSVLLSVTSSCISSNSVSIRISKSTHARRQDRSDEKTCQFYQ